MRAPRIVGLGDAVVDRYLERRVMYPGGSACNVAVHARRLGVESAFVGGISEDAAGRWIVHALEQEGVDVSQVQWYSSEQAYAEVRLGADGSREFGDWRPTPVPLDLTPARIARLSGAEMVHSSYSSLIEDQIERVASLAPVSFDFSYKDLQYAAPLLPALSAAFFSRPALEPREAIAFARGVAERGPGLVAVTRGELGSVLLRDGEAVVQPATATEPVVDTLGAGDAFAARVLVGAIEGEALAETARAAADYAASVCTIDGAFGWAMETAGEVQGS